MSYKNIGLCVLNPSEDDKEFISIKGCNCVAGTYGISSFYPDKEFHARISEPNLKIRYPDWKIDFAESYSLAQRCSEPNVNCFKTHHTLIGLTKLHFEPEYTEDFAKMGIDVTYEDDFMAGRQYSFHFRSGDKPTKSMREGLPQLNKLADYMCEHSESFRKDYNGMMRDYVMSPKRDSFVVLKYNGDSLFKVDGIVKTNGNKLSLLYSRTVEGRLD